MSKTVDSAPSLSPTITLAAISSTPVLEPANQASGRVEGSGPGSTDGPVLALEKTQGERLSLALSEGIDDTVTASMTLGSLLTGLSQPPTLDLLRTTGNQTLTSITVALNGGPAYDLYTL